MQCFRDRRRATRAMSLIEVLIAAVVFSAVFIPLYSVFVQSRGAVFKSRLALVANMAAQEEIEDWRLLSRLAGARIDSFTHGWEKVRDRKNALGRLLVGPAFKLAETLPMPRELDYPEFYDRIWTRLDVQETTDGFIYPALLHVMWQEKGEAMTPKSMNSREGFSRFEFYLVRPPRGV